MTRRLKELDGWIHIRAVQPGKSKLVEESHSLVLKRGDKNSR